MKIVEGILLAVPSLASAAGTVIDCPATLVVDTAASAPAGWQALSPATPRPLARIGLFAGPPEQGGALVPDKSTTQGQESKDLWLFGREVPEGLWAACYYTDTTAYLAKKLEAAVSRCEARYQSTRSGTRLKLLGMRCQ